jgi:universal stress protein E
MALCNDVLVVMDKPTRAQVALARALALQDAGRGQLTLAAFVYHPMAEQTETFDTHQRRAVRAALLHERAQWLRERVLDAGAAARDVTLETVWTKDLAGWVTRTAEERHVTLVVKSVNPSQTMLHTPTDWRLLRDCPVPVLLVAGRPWRKKPVVLATLDLKRTDRRHTRLNQKVLDTAAEIGAVTGGVVHAVHAIEISEVLRDLDIVDSRKAVTQARVRAGTACDRLVASYGIPSTRVHLPVGKAGAAIQRIALKIKADLLVLGTTARRGLRGFVIGNTAERILTKTGCDVLALKP